MKYAIIVGTRPEIIKMAPIIKECERKKIPFILIHSNQHYSPEMDQVFFEELDLKPPHYNLNIGSGKHGNQIGRILIAIEPILEEERPDVILVQGDTNTTAAAALAASKLDIKIAHIEAGLRSYDKRMPEETNRIMTDHLSDYLFAVTKTQKDILIGEGIDSAKIYIVGNTVADTLISSEHIYSKSTILEKNDLKKSEYILVTIHRASNVDTKESLEKVIKVLDYLTTRYNNFKIIWPIHPRTKKNIDDFNLKLPKSLIQLTPQKYSDFITLQKHAKLVVTDSGGLQEEACILNVPCITLRENTERPETLDVKANFLVGLDVKKVEEALNYFENSKQRWVNPFGDGSTSKQIIRILGENIEK